MQNPLTYCMLCLCHWELWYILDPRNIGIVRERTLKYPFAWDVFVIIQLQTDPKMLLAFCQLFHSSSKSLAVSMRPCLGREVSESLYSHLPKSPCSYQNWAGAPNLFCHCSLLPNVPAQISLFPANFCPDHTAPKYPPKRALIKHQFWLVNVLLCSLEFVHNISYLLMVGFMHLAVSWDIWIQF